MFFKKENQKKKNIKENKGSESSLIFLNLDDPFVGPCRLRILIFRAYREDQYYEKYHSQVVLTIL